MWFLWNVLTDPIKFLSNMTGQPFTTDNVLEHAICSNIWQLPHQLNSIT